MPLQKYEKPPAAFDKSVDAGRLRMRQELVSGLDELARREAIQPRMRSVYAFIDAAKQEVIGNPLEFIQSRKLRRQPLALDVIEMQHRCMGRKAGPHRRNSVVIRPINQPDEAPPIRLVAQVRSDRLATGDDQRVDFRIR